MAASFPTSIKFFNTFVDQAGGLPNPNLAIDFAANTNELHDEVVAIESLLGTMPFSGTPYTTLGGALSDLYINKAPVTHTHAHSSLLGDNVGDDHPQYIRVDGTRGFTGPVTAPAAAVNSQLATLGQVQGLNFSTNASVAALIAAAVAPLCIGEFSQSGPMPGMPNPIDDSWMVTGGYVDFTTDISGNISVFYTGVFTQTVIAFCPINMPTGAYDWRFSECTVISTTLTGSVVQFVDHNGAVIGNREVAFSWIALGI